MTCMQQDPLSPGLTVGHTGSEATATMSMENSHNLMKKSKMETLM